MAAKKGREHEEPGVARETAKSGMVQPQSATSRDIVGRRC